MSKQEAPTTAVHFDMTSRYKHADAPSELNFMLTTFQVGKGKLHPEFDQGIDDLVAAIRGSHESLQDALDNPSILTSLRLHRRRAEPKSKKTYITFKFIDRCEFNAGGRHEVLIAWLEFDLEVDRQLSTDQLRKLARRRFRHVKRLLREMVHFEEYCHTRAEHFCQTDDTDMRLVAKEVDELVGREVDETTYEALNRHPELLLLEEPVGLLESYI